MTNQFNQKCLNCNAPISDYGCDCNDEDKRERQEWQEERDRDRKEKGEFGDYANKILGRTEWYMIPTFEEYITASEEKDDDMNERRKVSGRRMWSGIMERARPAQKPEGMTNKEWQREKRRKKSELEEQGVKTMTQYDRDVETKHQLSPWWIINHEMSKISCECDADELRVGECCSTCKLLRKVHANMSDLFKDASEGRSTII